MRRIDIFIGTGKERDGAEIHPQRRQAWSLDVLGHAAETFGGGTLATSTGSWKDPAGDVVVESGVVLTLFVPHHITTHNVGEFARQMGAKLNQACVVLVDTMPNIVQFIDIHVTLADIIAKR